MRVLTLTHETHRADGIFGTLFREDGSVLLATLGHAYAQADGSYQPKLVCGTYTCVLGQHELHSGPIETFEITGVPGHSGILFHPGNYNSDSEGCQLVGRDIVVDAQGRWMLDFSRDAFRSFLTEMGTDSFMLIVKDNDVLA